jgi:glycosyltransferase involved in cell wall biosynthesis
MHLCAIAFKHCWQDEKGTWLSEGGHPLQMAGFASLFDSMTLVIARRGSPGKGGMPLPLQAEIVALRSPTGDDLRRKISVVLNLPYYVRSLARVIRKADVVHTAVPSDIGFIGILLARLWHKKLIVRYSGSWQATSQTTMMNRITRSLMESLAGGDNVMLATGEGDTPPAEGISWIFSTALSKKELGQALLELNRGLSVPPRLAYIGRLSDEKGVRVLIGALDLLSRDGVNPMPALTIIGDGPERENLESQVRASSCPASIQFTGQLDRSALNGTLARIDVVVQPSLTEGFSKAWLDAFAHGLPVLTSDVGAAGSVIGRNGERGWLVPPGDARALAAMVRKVMSGQYDWPALRKGCRAYVEGKTLEVWAETIGTICARQWNAKFENGKLRDK